ncbi:MAG: hypothetical protein AABW59_03595, partial [archaeon]
MRRRKAREIPGQLAFSFPPKYAQKVMFPRKKANVGKAGEKWENMFFSQLTPAQIAQKEGVPVNLVVMALGRTLGSTPKADELFRGAWVRTGKEHPTIQLRERVAKKTFDAARAIADLMQKDNSYGSVRARVEGYAELVRKRERSRKLDGLTGLKLNLAERKPTRLDEVAKESLKFVIAFPLDPSKADFSGKVNSKGVVYTKHLAAYLISRGI